MPVKPVNANQALFSHFGGKAFAGLNSKNLDPWFFLTSRPRSFAGMAHLELYLLPVPVSETESRDWIGPEFKACIQDNNLFVVENIRTARRFIASLKTGKVIDEIEFLVLDKDTDSASLALIWKKFREVGKAVLMSESGCPAVADPGARLVERVQGAGGRVVPFVGPSSILLALMGSGLSGQQFAFHGYLPIDAGLRDKRIRELETESARLGRTQIFIETPFRNNRIWDSFLAVLQPGTRLCLAMDVLGKNQVIRQMAVSDWRKQPQVVWEKLPAIFLFQAGDQKY